MSFQWLYHSRDQRNLVQMWQPTGMKLYIIQKKHNDPCIACQFIGKLRWPKFLEQWLTHCCQANRAIMSAAWKSWWVSCCPCRLKPSHDFENASHLLRFSNMNYLHISGQMANILSYFAFSIANISVYQQNSILTILSGIRVLQTPWKTKIC